MILQACEAARSLIPSLGAAPLSVAFVRTTRPKYLIFAKDTRRPEVVVQFGPADELLRIHRILLALAPELGRVVPASLACEPWAAELHVNVQSGLEGVPWFVMQKVFGTKEAWLGLLRQALETLETFRRAVRLFPEFTKRIDPADELACVVAVSRARGVVLSDRAERRIAAAGERLRSLGSRLAVAQHGDYGLNNLLVSRAEATLRIIDFDEFGMTYMPLQDEVGLALSMHLTHGASSGVSFGEAIEVCTAAAVSAAPELKAAGDALLTFHLLWRLNRCYGEPRRSVLQSALLDLLASSWLPEWSPAAER